MKRLATACGILALWAATPSASHAQADMVAGWDFSQYAGDGFMSTDDGSTFTNTLGANYSDFLPPPGPPDFGCGCGPAAATYGMMYVDGSFGSTTVAAGSGSEEFVPSAAVGGSLASNLGAPAFTDFDSFSFLTDQGQLNTESLAMIATTSASVVFEADLSSNPGETGSNWSVSFGARTFSGVSSVAIEFSSDGTTFQPFGSVNLTTVDTQFSVALGTAASDVGYVRLGFAPSGADQPLIDNLAILAEVSGGPTTTTTTTTTTSTTTSSTTSTTTSTTTTTVPGGTTTTSTSPASTTTTTTTPTTPSTTTSSLPSTTTTSTTSTTLGTTTTTTLPPGDLSGSYLSVDTVQKALDPSNQGFANIDTPSGQFCLAGLVRGTDTSHFPNREVRFEYRSQGTIQKATRKKVSAGFSDVDLTLTIEDTSGTLFEGSVTTGCKLKAGLGRAGDRLKARLQCLLNTNLIDLGLPSDLVGTVTNAFPKQGHIKVDASKGKVRFTHKGMPTSGSPSPLTCDLAGPAG